MCGSSQNASRTPTTPRGHFWTHPPPPALKGFQGQSKGPVRFFDKVFALQKTWRGTLGPIRYILQPIICHPCRVENTTPPVEKNFSHIYDWRWLTHVRLRSHFQAQLLSLPSCHSSHSSFDGFILDFFSPLSPFFRFLHFFYFFPIFFIFLVWSFVLFMKVTILLPLLPIIQFAYR